MIMADYATAMADYWTVMADYWLVMVDYLWLGVITGWLRVIPVFSNYGYASTKPKVVTNLENSGHLKNCQNLRENSGKFGFLYKNPRKLRKNEKYGT